MLFCHFFNFRWHTELAFEEENRRSTESLKGYKCCGMARETDTLEFFMIILPLKKIELLSI